MTNFYKKYLPSTLEIPYKKGMYFSFDFGWYSIYLDIVNIKKRGRGVCLMGKHDKSYFLTVLYLFCQKS